MRVAGFVDGDAHAGAHDECAAGAHAEPAAEPAAEPTAERAAERADQHTTQDDRMSSDTTAKRSLRDESVRSSRDS